MQAPPAGALVPLLACLAIAQIAVIQIQVVEGEGAVHLAGSRSARVLTVEVRDEMGRAVEGAAVTFQLPEEGGGGVFANGQRSAMAVSDASGRASVRDVRWNRTAGAFAIRITAVKGAARAGGVSTQYIAGPKSASRGSGASAPRGVRKWIAVALVSGVAAAATLAVAGGGASRPAQAAAAAAPAVSIGTPAIRVGRP